MATSNEAEVFAGIRWLMNTLENCAMEKYMSAADKAQAWADIRTVMGLAILACKGIHAADDEQGYPGFQPDVVEAAIARLGGIDACHDCGDWECCGNTCKAVCV